MSQKETDLIKERIDIVDLISKNVTLKKAGKNYIGLCPFHGEKTPSFIVNPVIQRYKCFGCGKSGDIFNFIEDYEKIDFPEALEKLAGIAGVQIQKREVDPLVQKAEEINKIANNFFVKTLNTDLGKKAKAYLLNRGLNEDSIKAFSIGFAPGNGLVLEHFKRYPQYTKRELIDSGVFTEKNGQPRERFINRVMFPIKSTNGTVIAFSGRVLPGDDFGPKYLNSPETAIFHKRYNLYGTYEAKQSIRESDLCILCEGPTDVISTHNNGIKNIVAPLGTALTIDQLKIIKNYTKNLLLFFDSDEAGQKAAERAYLMATELDMSVFAGNTGKYKDLDELIRAEPEKLKSILDSKTDAFSYLLASKIDKEKLDLTEFRDYSLVVKYIKDLLTPIKDPASRDFFAQKAEKMTNIKADDLITSPTTSAPQQPSTIKAEGLNQKKYDEISHKLTIEEYFLHLVLSSERFDLVEEEKIKYFMNSKVIKILNLIVQSKIKDNKALLSTEEIQSDQAITDLISKVHIYHPQDILENEELSPDLEHEITQTFERIKKRNLLRWLTKLRLELSLAEEKGEEEKIETLLLRISKYTEEITKNDKRP